MLESWTTQRIMAINEEWCEPLSPKISLLSMLHHIRADEQQYREVLGIHFTLWWELCPCGCDGGIRKFEVRKEEGKTQ